MAAPADRPGARKPARVIVLGCSGSGKSTVAARFAAQHGLPFIATDAVYWRDGWRPAPMSDVKAWLEATTVGESWVLDGNFDAQRDILWARADLAIWLDLPWVTTIGRVARRNLGWWLGGAEIWGGQRMTWFRAVGGIRHAARSHTGKRRGYPAMLAAFSDLAVIRIRSAHELESWLGAGLPVMDQLAGRVGRTKWMSSCGLPSCQPVTRATSRAPWE